MMANELTLDAETQRQLDIVMAVALIKTLYSQNKIPESVYKKIRKKAEKDIEKVKKSC